MKLSKKDLDYRPDSYWEFSNPLDAILAKVSSRNRRQMIIDYWNSGKLEELDDELLKDEISVESREALARIHPSFMGGEYLPPKKADTVAIVTIDLRSVTSDVIELRATRQKSGRIRYRWVDEYQSEGLAFSQPRETSVKPLTFGQLIQFIVGSSSEVGELPLCYNEYNCQGGRGRSELRYFTSMSSVFYPKLADWFKGLVEEWVNEMERPIHDDVDESE